MRRFHCRRSSDVRLFMRRGSVRVSGPSRRIHVAGNPAETHAVFEHKDHISAIGAAWKAIWDQVHSPGFQAADGPSFEPKSGSSVVLAVADY